MVDPAPMLPDPLMLPELPMDEPDVPALPFMVPLFIAPDVPVPDIPGEPEVVEPDVPLPIDPEPLIPLPEPDVLCANAIDDAPTSATAAMIPVTFLISLSLVAIENGPPR